MFAIVFQRWMHGVVFCLIVWSCLYRTGAAQTSADILVYSATPAGIAAALAAAEDECQVWLVEPTQRLGGLVTCGLSHTDYHSRESLSGAFLKFSRAVQEHYNQRYGSDSPQAKSCDQGVFAEPSVNLAVFEQMLAGQSRIKLLKGWQLDQVHWQPGQEQRSIQAVTFRDQPSSLRRVECRIVIDASYEGDLMALAGVPWRVGREGKSEFNESLAPEVADGQLQAYNFRFVMTREANNRVTPQPPKGYRREDFVGVLDALKSEQIKSVFGYPGGCIFKAHLPPLPNGKYDINDVSRSLVRLSLPGKNLGWPNGTPDERRAIFDEHLRDQVGLLYFLQTDTAVPEKFRKEAAEWGWCRDEFQESDYLPPQLYIREARRMIGSVIFTQQDCECAPKDARAVFHGSSIAMGDYGNNCHGTFHEGPRFGGKHTGEFYNPVPPYQVPYGVLVPKEVNNLLVACAVSSSHVGFCGLRLEPIWMSLGEAAGYAAAQAYRRSCHVQQVAVRTLQSRLHRAGAATIYVSDCLPDHPDFRAVQWWGVLGGLHGLEPRPEKPGERGQQLHGQYYAASPYHAVELDKTLDEKTAERWRVLARMEGIEESALPGKQDRVTRGAFIRAAFAAAEKAGLTKSQAAMPRAHRLAVPNQHAPGEVDNAELARKVVSDASTLAGIVVDDCDAELTGQWQYSTHTPPYVGVGYLHDMTAGKGSKKAKFIPKLTKPGMYEVRMAHCSNIRRTTSALVTIQHANGQDTLRVNQQQPAEHNALFKTLGRYRFDPNQPAWVEISNAGTEGKVVIADAIQFLPLE